MLTSYHVHTTFSDGECSINEMIDAAISLGIDELGISDHYVLLPDNMTVPWSMQLSQLDEYFDALQAARVDAAGRIVIKQGVEADYSPFTIDDLKDRLSKFEIDYIIGSVHLIDGFCIDESLELWEPIAEAQRNDIIRAYWSYIAKMAASGLFSFAGHLDIYKKFGIFPSIDITADIEFALDAIATSGMAVELNTSGWSKYVCEAYPSPFILSECKKRSIPVLITADVHHKSHLIHDYSRAKALLSDIGYDQLATFSEKKISLAD